ncbi:MAG TPA: hypothetical protein VHK01_10585 [Lacipirellulaceae bacterium]|nr:hypothetical protein [Lacipirellulaceae bacterium]
MTVQLQNLKKPITWPAPPANPGNEPIFWFIAWLSVTVAGGIFGVIVAIADELGFAIIGFIAGIIVAGIYAIPIVATFGILTWTLWLSRFAVVMAAIAGTFTGILSSATLLGDPLEFESIPLAGCIGGVVTACVTGFYWRKLRQWGYGAEVAADSTWQFSLRDLFLRFTIATMILAAWMFAITRYFAS